MLSSAIVVFREVLEVALILGVIGAATKGLPSRGYWILAGLGLGIIGSVLIAMFADAISGLAEGFGQELFNASILLIAAGMIGWTVLWMRKHGRQISQHVRDLSRGVMAGELPLYSLTLVIMLAVLREGSEIVLFTHGLLAAGQTVSTVLTGSMIGLAVGSAVGFMLYMGLIQISPRYFFAVTSWVLMFVAAGMVSVAVKYLVAADVITTWVNPVWDSSGWLPEHSLIGQALHTLLGYSDQPMGVQVLFYAMTLSILVLAMHRIDRGFKSLASQRLQTN